MGKASCQINFEMPNLIGALAASQERIERTIASTIQTMVGFRFDAEGAHNGHEKWLGLKMRQGQILSFTGLLRKSMSPPGAQGNPGPQGFVHSVGPLENLLTEVGSKVIYASVHNNGAVIRPKKKQALRFLNPASGKFIFSKEVTIPKRNFTDMNEKDLDELSETLANVVADILEHA